MWTPDNRTVERSIYKQGMQAQTWRKKNDQMLPVFISLPLSFLFWFSKKARWKFARKHRINLKATPWCGKEKEEKEINPRYTSIRTCKVQNPVNTKRWWGYRVTGAVIPYEWESKMVSSLWKTVQQFLTELNIYLLYKPAIMFIGTYTKELKTYVYIKTFI